MRYICPFEFLEIDISHPEQLKSEELLGISFWLEKEFQETRTLRYKGRKVNHAMAKRMVEALKDPTMRQFCWQLYRLPGLKNFLETGEPRWFNLIEREEKTEDSHFVGFVSEFYIDRYNALLDENLQAGDWDNVNKILLKRDWVAPEDYYDAFMSIRIFFRWRGLELTEIGKNGGMESAIKWRYLHPKMLQCLGSLALYYPQVCDHYAASLGEALVPTINKKRDFALGSDILLAAEQLPLTDDLAKAYQLVRRKLKSAIARAHPHEKLLIDLFPFRALRTGKWALWQGEPLKEQVGQWLFRAGGVVVLSLILLIAASRETRVNIPPSEIQMTDLPYINKHILSQQLFRVAGHAAMEKLPPPENSVAQTPVWNPYSQVLGVPPQKGLDPPVTIVNRSGKDIVLFLVGARPLQYKEFMPHIFVPDGFSRAVQSADLHPYTLYVYKGCDWQSDYLTLFPDVKVPGFTSQAEPPQILMREQSEIVYYPDADDAHREVIVR